MRMDPITPQQTIAAEEAVKSLVKAFQDLNAQGIQQRALILLAQKNASRFYSHDRRLAEKFQPSFWSKLEFHSLTRLVQALVLSPGELIQ